ncbi:MAG: 50S ribosomal protein L4 [Pseudomonadota bacterium]|nr:50S ribosomal protein L4 [Pseudomonadota bacterium]
MTNTDLKKIFNKDYNESLVHQVTVDYLSNKRSGTKAQRNRSAVSGGGDKPRPQKGSGRARAGTIRSPIWKGGGVTFAAKPNKSLKKINKKMYKSALNCIFSELVRKKRLHFVDDFKVAEPKTKLFLSQLATLKLTNALFIIDEKKINVFLAARNIKNIEVVSPAGVNPHNLMKYDNVVLDSKIVEIIQGLTT